MKTSLRFIVMMVIITSSMTMVGQRKVGLDIIVGANFQESATGFAGIGVAYTPFKYLKTAIGLEFLKSKSTNTYSYDYDLRYINEEYSESSRATLQAKIGPQWRFGQVSFHPYVGYGYSRFTDHFSQYTNSVINGGKAYTNTYINSTQYRNFDKTYSTEWQWGLETFINDRVGIDFSMYYLRAINHSSNYYDVLDGSIICCGDFYYYPSTARQNGMKLGVKYRIL